MTANIYFATKEEDVKWCTGASGNTVGKWLNDSLKLTIWKYQITKMNLISQMSYILWEHLIIVQYYGPHSWNKHLLRKSFVKALLQSSHSVQCNNLDQNAFMKNLHRNLFCPMELWVSWLTLSDWASKDLRLLVTFFSSSSRSPPLLWK